jgi:hypothetical protein
MVNFCKTNLGNCKPGPFLESPKALGIVFLGPFMLSKLLIHAGEASLVNFPTGSPSTMPWRYVPVCTDPLTFLWPYGPCVIHSLNDMSQPNFLMAFLEYAQVTTLQRLNTENSKQIVPEKELRAHSHNFHCERYINSHNLSAYNYIKWD